MSEIDSPQIFICYNSDDSNYARALARALKTEDRIVWIDHRSIKPGENWSQRIAAGIENSTVALVLMGKTGFGNFQQEEIKQLKKKKEVLKEKYLLVPITLPGYQQEMLSEDIYLYWIHQLNLEKRFCKKKNSVEVSYEGIARLRRVIDGNYSGGARNA